MQIMQVQVPPGVAPGMMFTIATPGGQQMQVQAQVPEGQMMQVQVPMETPTVMAQPVAVPMAAPGMVAPGMVAPGMAPGQVQAMPGWAPAQVVGYEQQVTVITTTQTVTGIPVDPSFFVPAKLGQATDPVPMLDMQTASILGAVNKFKVKQRMAWLEAISQG